MNAHLERCRNLAGRIPSWSTMRCLVGFDGFVDRIIDVVDSRSSPADYTPLATISDFARRVDRAAGHSANFELVVRRTKIGGNAAIMAEALLGFGTQLTFVGNIGVPSPQPVFAGLAQGAQEVVTLGDPGETDALEFRDGKLMLGKLAGLDTLCDERLWAAVGAERLRNWLRSHQAVATVNWTMTLGMNRIWQRLFEEIMPDLGSHRPYWFVDLADPAKRSPADLATAMQLLGRLQQRVEVVLGLNGSEACQVAGALGVSTYDGQEDVVAAAACAEAIRRKLGLGHVMIHLTGCAAAAGPQGTAASEGFRCSRPAITTGAGDHFNAGFLSALGAGCPLADCLLAGGATSGFYVRNGKSPSRRDLIAFLQGFVAE